MKKLLLSLVLLTGILHSQVTEIYIIRDKLDTLRIDVTDLQGGLDSSLAAPSKFTVTGGINQFALTWDDNSTNEQGFHLAVSNDGLAWGTNVTVAANETTYTYFEVGSGITRFFRISAFLGGLETALVTEFGTTLNTDDTTPPPAPYGLTAVGGDQLITLAWNDSSDAREEVAMYYVYHSPNIVPTGNVAYDSITALGYVDNGCPSNSTPACSPLERGVIWHYRVRSRDVNYNYSDYSNDAFDTTDTEIVGDTTSSPIFAITFENGLDDFTSIVGSPSTFTADASAKYEGVYGGLVYFNGSNLAYGIKDVSALPDTFYVSFKVKFDSINTLNAYKSDGFYTIVTASGSIFRFGVYSNVDSELWKWWVAYYDGNGQNYYTSDVDFSVEEWHLIEVKYKINATIGGAEIWVDSTRNAALSQLDRNTAGNVVTDLRLGSTYTFSSTTLEAGKTIYFDNFYADTTRIGSTGGTVIVVDTIPPNSPTGFIATGKYDINVEPNDSYVDCNWVDVSSDEAKFYIYRGTIDVYGGVLALKDSVDVNVINWTDATIALTDTTHYYEYGIRARDAAYNYSVLTSATRDSANLPGIPDTSTIIIPPVDEGSGWFVDKDATGSNDGKSWVNAWRSLADSTASNPFGINWRIVGATDTLYISGGLVSKTYTSVDGNGNMMALPLGQDSVLITKGTSLNHNGEVIFEGGRTAALGIYVNGRGTISSGITIQKLTFNNFTYAGIRLSGEQSGSIRHILIDSCRFTNIGRAGVHAGGTQTGSPTDSYDITISNSYFDDYNGDIGQSDNVYLQFMDSARVSHNTLIIDNPISYAIAGNTHCDNVQTFWVKNVIIDNNTVMTSNPTKLQGTQNLFTEESSPTGGTHIWYNNVVYKDYPLSHWNSAFRLKTVDSRTNYVIGNSFIGYGYVSDTDGATTYLYNNCFYGIDGYDNPSYFSEGTLAGQAGNLVYDPSNVYATWAGVSEGDPLYVNIIYSTFDLHVQTGSPTINNGGDYQSLVEGWGLVWEDVEGVARDASPTSGAYETVIGTAADTILIAAVIGDFGKDGGNELAVANLVKDVIVPDVVLAAGDDNYENGAASTIDINIGKYYHQYIYPYIGGYGAGSSDNVNHFWAVPGNHDWRASNLTPYKDYFTFPNQNGANETYYVYRESDLVTFYMIDSDSNEPDGVTEGSTQGIFMTGWMDTSTTTWNIVVNHHPPYSSGSSHGSTTSAQWDYASHGIDAVFSGHEHLYERCETGGVVYITDGSGGKSLYSFGSPIGESIVRYNSKYGATKLTISTSVLKIEHYSVDGILRDTRTLQK